MLTLRVDGSRVPVADGTGRMGVNLEMVPLDGVGKARDLLAQQTNATD